MFQVSPRRAPMPQPATSLSSPDEVDRLRASPARLWAVRGPVELRLDDLPDVERQRAQTRLTELAQVCGCAEGAAAGAVALLVTAGVWIARGTGLSVTSLAAAGAWVVGAALLAKLLRVVVARVRMRQVLDELARALAHRGRLPRHGALP